MKYFTVIIVLAVCMFFQANGQSYYSDYSSTDKQTILNENFNDNANDWCVGVKVEGKAQGAISGGNFMWQSLVTGTNPTCHINVPIDESRDFEIETSLKFVSGEDNNGIGIYWGGNDYSKNYYYRFAISGNGFYIISKYDGAWSQYKEWTESSLVNKTDYNKLTIRKVSGNLYFFLNENLIHSMPHPRFFGTNIGFQSNQNSMMYIDYLHVSYIEKQQLVTDYTGPEIVVNEPSVTRGYKITEANKQINVKGQVTDQSGVYEVNINGIEANLDADGNFQQIVKLAVGDNNITIKATDTKNNSSTYSFIIDRKPEIVNNDVVVNEEPETGEQKRLALVIGNSNYGGGQSLKNPANDANLMATTLQGLGFEVIKRIDGNKQSIELAIKEFSKKLPNYNIALFYYAGHGIQVDGINYLIPTDAKLEDKSDCKFEAVSVNFIVEEFEQYPDNTNIVILDACRNNPFRSWARGGERGFKAIAPTSGTIIAFATSEGATASDGTGQNGLFTQELVKQMNKPQSIESVFKKTRVEVEKLSNSAQSPQEWTKLKGDFWFKK
jgi:hypothetical protein